MTETCCVKVDSCPNIVADIKASSRRNCMAFIHCCTSGFSPKDIGQIIVSTTGSTTGQVVVVPPCTQTAEQATVAELRTECKRRGLRNYSRLKKNELVRLLEGRSHVLLIDAL